MKCVPILFRFCLAARPALFGVVLVFWRKPSTSSRSPVTWKINAVTTLFVIRSKAGAGMKTFRNSLILRLTFVAVCLPMLGIAQTVITSVSGYFTSNDSYQHAVVATDDGRLHETYFDPKRGIFHDELGCFGQIIDQSGFFSVDDGLQHAIVARLDGSIRDFSFSAASGQKLSDSIATVQNLVSVSAFYAADDKSRIVLTGSTDGSIREIWYGANTPIRGGEVIVTIPGLIHMAGFYTPDDKMRHAIVATNKGDVIEVYYSSASGVHVTTPLLQTCRKLSPSPLSTRPTIRCATQLSPPETARFTRSSTAEL